MTIYYQNSKGDKVNLEEWPIVIQDKEALFSNKWEYDSKNITDSRGKITRIYKTIAELSITLAIFADSSEEFRRVMDRILKVTEYDIYALTPGKLWIGEYYISCYIITNEYSNYEENFYTTDKKVTLVSEYPFWICETKNTFKAGSIQEAGQNFDYPYDYLYDYANTLINKKIINENTASCDFELIIYGACVNPTIIIGTQLYNVNCNIASGEYLVINSQNKKIYKVAPDGSTENKFNVRNREYYVFEKIPEGIHTVTWNGLFGFDVTIFEERSEPRWI